MTVNERIKEIIKSNKGLTQKGMANKIGAAPTTVNYWMRENTSIPSEYIKPIADYLGVSCEYLLTGKEPAPAEMSDEDAEWFDMIHQLPDEAKPVIKDMIKGYVNRS